MTHTKPVDVLLVADYLLLKAKQEGKIVTNKKLQKLLYYTQAWSLALNDKKVFDDKIEAWIHGPAIKKVYLEYQKFGASPINKDVSEEVVSRMPEDLLPIIDQVWDVYSGFDANYLEYLTHSEKPWQDARAGLEPHISSENEITPQSMKEFYSTLAAHG